MKKIIRRVLLVVGVIVILFVGIGLYYYYPMLAMPRVEAGQIPDTNVYIANAMSAVYLIKTDDGYVMIDAGLTSEALQKSLEEAMIDPNDIKWIFLTHSDGDHVTGLTLFPNAEIYMSEDEVPLINGTVKRSVFGGNTMPFGVDIDKIMLLADGQELSFNGVSIECIKAPGHTIGSMVYLVDGTYLFTGDVFKVKDGNKSVHPYSMDTELSKKTIEQLQSNIDDSSLVLTSHYGVYPK
jgi:glyoxylase-like metal-dependent hydrolase (beta-lactamase superfamily II)